jgi:transmembrane sensor
MDEAIIQQLNGTKDPVLEERLANWRAASDKNEARYQEVVFVWARTEYLLTARPREHPPTIRELVERRLMRERAKRFAPRPDSARRWQAGLLRAAVLTAVFLAGLVSNLLLFGSEKEPVMSVETVVTGVGELATIRLDDGTVVRVGPESQFRVLDRSAGREVWLDGRAYFAVSQDIGRPFRVRTKKGDVTVVGTRFDLEVKHDGLTVIVVEGKVTLGRGNDSIDVNASEVLRLDDHRPGQVTRPDDVLVHLEWVGNFLAFERTPLRQVVVEVSKLFDAHVEIIGDELGERTITGWYVGAEFRDTIEAICLVAGARCVINGNSALIQP